MSVNLKGTFLCCKAAAGHMLGQQLGRIINISSIAGKHGRGGISAYAASKAGVISFTESLAEELGPFNVTVNAICPGYINTEMWKGGIAPGAATVIDVEREEAFDAFMKKDTPMGRPQRPEEIGEGAVFLCKADKEDVLWNEKIHYTLATDPDESTKNAYMKPPTLSLEPPSTTSSSSWTDRFRVKTHLSWTVRR